MDYQFAVAQDLETAWLNFEPDIPLKSNQDGSPHIFYVERPDDTTAKIKRTLLRPSLKPAKFFLSGHRGCGKSTELYRLAANPDILAKFFPIHFSIRDANDIGDLDFRDVLFSIAVQMYTQYTNSGGRLKKALLKEIEQWQGGIEKTVTIDSSRIKDFEIDGRLGQVFAQFGLKMKLEPKTRSEIRQVIEQDLTGLVEIINLMAADIQGNEKRQPLILIDDLDKPDLELAKKIFFERQQIMFSLNCGIIYTVSSSLFYSQEIRTAQATEALFLPNIKVWAHGGTTEPDGEGRYTLKTFIHRRIGQNLISEDALELIITQCGGVFRELTRLMRTAVDRAISKNHSQVTLPDVRRATAEIRNEYRRILTKKQLDELAVINQTKTLQDPPEATELLQMLAALEYQNDSNWFDVHPVILPLLVDQP
jgi:hypothetical protein